LFNKCYQ